MAGSIVCAFAAVAQFAPALIGGLYWRGASRAALDQSAAAISDFDAALAIDASSDVTHYNHGLALRALKRPREAAASFDRALAINPSVAETWSSRGAVRIAEIVEPKAEFVTVPAPASPSM